MPKVFISYRRADTGDLCDRLATRLRWALGEDAVFRDVNTILAGSSFPHALREGVEACPVTLALIGPAWLAPVGTPPRRRLDDPEDWVRAEIASALRLGRLVIPVLASGAPALESANLPPDLAPLARFTPMPLRPDPFFDGDVRALTRAIRPYAAQGPASWALLLGGVFLLFAYLSMLALGVIPDGVALVIWIGNYVAQIALGSYASWRALVRREWGWLAAGALTLFAGVAQIVTPLPSATTTRVYTGIELVVASPLAAGLCLLAGWAGPRLARAPDTLRARRTAWHIALAIMLALTAALQVINWLLLATQFSGAGTTLLIGLFYVGMALMAAIMTGATGVVASVWAFTYRHVWWGVGALALTMGACLAEILQLNSASVAIAVAGVVAPVGFLLYMLVWLTSFAARTPTPSQGARLKAERA